jgi:peptidoglycan/xylan/chitin deacetylase (PgdA/CDA1 family)
MAKTEQAIVRVRTRVRMDMNFISRLIVVMAAAGGLCAQEHQVAITVDDLPRGGDSPGSAAADLAMTMKLLTPFKNDKIPLTGFVNECRHADEAQELLPLWTAAGADLGNHTCSHLDLSSTSVAEFEADVLKGERVTSAVLGRMPPYFRYPYLHTGMTPEVREAVEAFLKKRGYTMAPVTLDDEDYVFARVYADKLAQGNAAEAARVLAAYVKYMDGIFAFFEGWGVKVTGHDVKQILLIHASQLNADAMPHLLQMMRRRGYEFVSLWEALTDDAYQLPDSYAGPQGISWIHRWAMEKGMKVQWEPEAPAWIAAAYKASVK